MSVFLSIIIPCYEMQGNGVKFLTRLLQTIERQDQPQAEYEVIVSDHSINNDLENVCKSFNIPILYFVNKENRGSSSANVNNAIKRASGKFLKPIFQDDFFVNQTALIDLCNLTQDSTSSWFAHRYIHFNGKDFERERIPFYTDCIIEGENTIGPPSCVVFPNDNNFFDENLIWFMDTELYFRLHQKYGAPIILSDVSYIANMCWEGQITNTKITKELIEKELNYVKQKHL
jgi:glycosyltransferase involved in cell wall biosynthesis